MKRQFSVSRRNAIKNMALLTCGIHAKNLLPPYLSTFLINHEKLPGGEIDSLGYPPPVSNSFFVGGYFSSDKFRHAIVANRTGKVKEVFYKSSAGKGVSYLACFDEIIAMDSFFSPDDGNQHQIVATKNGEIHEVYFKPGEIHYDKLPIGSFAGIVDIASFYCEDDKMRIVIVATNDGNIREIFFNPSIGVHVTTPPLVNLNGVKSIAGFYAKDDKMRIVIAATQDGNVHEIFYRSNIGTHLTTPPLAKFNNIVDIAAFYTDDDKMRVVIVATDDGSLHEVFYKQSIGVHISQPALASFSGIERVAGFYTADDKMRIVIAVTKDGNVREVFYNPSIGVHVSQPALANLKPSSPFIEDISPDPNNVNAATKADFRDNSTSGRVIGIDGTKSQLYAMVEKSGLWKSVNGGTWKRLPTVPAVTRLYNGPQLAVSPANSSQVAVGNAFTGAWESTNGGAAWANILNPQKFGCTEKDIHSLAYGPSNELYVATNCGIATRQSLGAVFSFFKTSKPITAISVSQTKSWARTDTDLYISTTKGKTWALAGNIPTEAANKFTHALAAFDDFVYIPFSVAGVNQGNGCQTCGADVKLAIFNAKTKKWITQNVKFAGCNVCDGTGLSAGPMPIRSFITKSALPKKIGGAFQLMFSPGQELYQATGVNVDGTVTSWNRIGLANCVGCPPGQTDIHSDIWDFNMDATGLTAWVACDGGVSRKTFNSSFVFPAGNWDHPIDGLHTHKMVTLTVLPKNPIDSPYISYPTGDNNAWGRNSAPLLFPTAQWQAISAGGDVNFSLGDAGQSKFAVLARHQKLATLMNFSTSPTPITLSNSSPGPDAPARMQCISTARGMASNLDVLMLVTLPLTFFDPGSNSYKPVSNTLSVGQNSNGNPVLIRNKNFSSSPDINLNKGVGWDVEINSLPANAEGFYVSGQPNSPVYYCYSNSNNNLQLFKWDGAKWNPLPITGLMYSSASILTGPAFVNPYNSNMIFAVTGTGIQLSTTGGTGFGVDNKLTSLVKGPGGNESINSITQISFNYDNPGQIVAGTTWGGVFFRDNNGQWTDFSNLMPSPKSPVIGVAIDCECLYVATDGRGLWRINNYKDK